MEPTDPTKKNRERDEKLFDLGFEDDASEEGELITYDDSQILPNPSMLSRSKDSRRTVIHGKEAYHQAGIANSPPLFAEASNFPECTQMRCWKIENGQPVGLGVIDSNALEEDLIEKFRSAMPKPGDGKAVFKLRPLDINGTELGTEFTRLISEHHHLLKISTSKLNSSSGGIQSEMIGMLKETLKVSQDALHSERSRVQTLMAEMAKERMDLATKTASGISSISERMMQADAERSKALLRQEELRNQQAQDNMAAFFQSNIEVLQAERDRAQTLSDQQIERDKVFYNQMLQRESANRQKDKDDAQNQMQGLKNDFMMRMEEERLKRERTRQEFEQKMALQRQEWEYKRKAEQEEYERRERQRIRDAEQKTLRESRDQKERESMRTRSHEMKMRELELQAQRDREHQERMMQLQLMASKKDEATSIKGTLKEATKLLKDFGLEPKDLIDRLLGSNDSGTSSEVIGAITNIAGNAAEVMKESIKAKANEGGIPYQPPPYANPMLTQHQTPPPPPSQPIVTPPPSPPSLKSTLPLSDQRRVRKDLRTLISKFKSTPEENWEKMLTGAITNNFDIFKYCNEVSVRNTLKEASAPHEMIEKLIIQLKNNPIVPEDMRYEP